MRIALLLIAVFISLQVAASEFGSVVAIERHGGRIVYEVEGKKVGDLDRVMSVLRERAQKTKIRPIDDTAIILASKSLSVSEIHNLYSALQAYGFRVIRVFAFDEDKERLQELKLAVQVIPFTRQRSRLIEAIGK